MNEARKRKIVIPQPSKFNNQPGYGVTAELEGRSIIVGNAAMLGQLSSLPLAANGTNRLHR